MAHASAPPHRPPAPLWRRAAARAIDAATVFFVVWALVVTRIFFFMDPLSDRIHPAPWNRAFVATATFVLLSAVYEVFFLVHNKGQTPGKDVMKVRVQHADGREDLAVATAFARWVLPGLAVLVPPVWLAALVVAGTGATALANGRRSLHDLLAGTVVVPYDRDREDPESRMRARRPRRFAFGLGALTHEENDR